MFDYFEKRKAEKEKQERENPTHKPTQSQLFIKVIVGGYLVYLAWGIYKDGALVNHTGWQLALMIGAMALFAVFGAVYCVMALRALAQKDYYDPNASSETAEAPELPPEEESGEEPEEETEENTGEKE